MVWHCFFGVKSCLQKMNLNNKFLFLFFVPVNVVSKKLLLFYMYLRKTTIKTKDLFIIFSYFCPFWYPSLWTRTEQPGNPFNNWVYRVFLYSTYIRLMYAYRECMWLCVYVFYSNKLFKYFYFIKFILCG